MKRKRSQIAEPVKIFDIDPTAPKIADIIVKRQTTYPPVYVVPKVRNNSVPGQPRIDRAKFEGQVALRVDAPTANGFRRVNHAVTPWYFDISRFHFRRPDIVVMSQRTTPIVQRVKCPTAIFNIY